MSHSAAVSRVTACPAGTRIYPQDALPRIAQRSSSAQRRPRHRPTVALVGSPRAACRSRSGCAAPRRGADRREISRSDQTASLSTFTATTCMCAGGHAPRRAQPVRSATPSSTSARGPQRSSSSTTSSIRAARSRFDRRADRVRRPDRVQLPPRRPRHREASDPPDYASAEPARKRNRFACRSRIGRDREVDRVVLLGEEGDMTETCVSSAVSSSRRRTKQAGKSRLAHRPYAGRRSSACFSTAAIVAAVSARDNKKLPTLRRPTRADRVF